MSTNLEKFIEEIDEDINDLWILTTAVKAGHIEYPIDCPGDCYRYRVRGLFYNPYFKKFYINCEDGVDELFAKDYGITWRI